MHFLLFGTLSSPLPPAPLLRGVSSFKNQINSICYGGRFQPHPYAGRPDPLLRGEGGTAVSVA